MRDLAGDESRPLPEVLLVNSADRALISPITVLIVDDDRWTTRALAAVLASEPGIRVLGAVHCGEDAVAAYRAEHTRVVLMDVNLGAGMTGVDATAAILREDPEARVVILTTTAAGPGLARALQAGALAALRKEASEADLIAMVRAAAQGDAPSLVRGLADDLLMSGGVQDAAPAPALTPSEYRILRLLCTGRSYGEIIEQLHISENTLETHTRHLREKLGAKNLAQLVVRALEYRFVSI